MMNYRTVTIAVVGLFLSLSFFVSSGMAVEKDGVMMRDGKMWRLQDGKEIGRMDRETTMSNGTKVLMNGKSMESADPRPTSRTAERLCVRSSSSHEHATDSAS